MVKAAISRVLDAPPTDNPPSSPESDRSTLVTEQADTTWAARQDSGSSSNPSGSDPVLCSDLVIAQTDNTITLDLTNSNPVSPTPTGSNPARSTHDPTSPDIAESNPASASSSSSSSASADSDIVWSAVSEPGCPPGLEMWGSNTVWVGSAKFGSANRTGLDSSIDWTGSDAEEGSSSHCRNSDEGGDGAGNPSGGSEQSWCPALDPVWSPPETQIMPTSPEDSDVGDKDAATSGRPVQNWCPELDPAWPPETDRSATHAESDAGADDTAHSSGWSVQNLPPALDPVRPPVTDSATRTDLNAGGDDSTDLGGSNQDFPELDHLSSPVAELVSSPGQETLGSDPIQGGSAEGSLSMDTAWLQGAALVYSPASGYMRSPALGFGDDREGEGCVETEVDGSDWTQAVAERFRCCSSRVASCFSVANLALVSGLINSFFFVVTVAVLLGEDGLAGIDFVCASRYLFFFSALTSVVRLTVSLMTPLEDIH